MMTFDPGATGRAIATVDQEAMSIGRGVSRALSINGDMRDLRDLAFRLGRLEDALAGLRLHPNAIVTRMVTFVCFARGLRPTELISNRRAKRVAHPRFAIMWAARELTPYSYPQIAAAMGGFDHTSIMHGCRRAEQLRRTDPEFLMLTDAMIAHFSAPAEVKEDNPCLPL